MRWTPRFLAYQAILMAYDPSPTLQERFDNARQVLIEMFPSRRRPGKTYQGFVKAFRDLSPKMMEAFMAHLRGCHQQVAGEFWQRWGWTLFACDGSRVEVPRTRKNEKEFGRAGREKTGPQLGLTAMYHMGTGLPWDWRIGPGTESERSQLRDMLDTLPAGALLVADAGFTGYDLFQSLIEKGLFFLIRVGANVTLLKDLGLEIEVDGDTVWLWPTGKRSDPPLKLRLIHIRTESGEMYLVTNVFDRQRLPDELAETIYRMRWGVEVFFRGFKQTLGHQKMRSDAPDQALLELHWNLCGMLLLGLMGVKALIATGHDPLGLSVATALRVVREAMRTPRVWRFKGDLWVTLASAVKDGYRRRGSKKARDWPHKKHESPPGAPNIRTATENERARAKRVYKAA